MSTETRTPLTQTGARHLPRIPALVGLLTLLMLIAVGLYLESIARTIVSTRRARTGVVYLNGIRHFTQAAVEYQRTAADHVVRGSASLADVKQKADAVDAQLHELTGRDAGLSAGGKTHVPLTAMRDEWTALQGDADKWFKNGNIEPIVERCSAILVRSAELADAVVEASNLSRDPEPMASRSQLLMRRTLSNAGDLSRASLDFETLGQAKKTDRAFATRINRMLGHLEAQATLFRLDYSNLETQKRDVYRVRLEITAHDQEAKHEDFVRRLQRDVSQDSAVLDDRTIKASRDAAQRAIEADLAVFDRTESILSAELEERLGAQYQTILVVIIAAIGAVLLAAYVAYQSHNVALAVAATMEPVSEPLPPARLEDPESLQRAITKLRDDVGAAVRGDLTRQVEVGSDVLTPLAGVCNGLIVQMRRLVARVRDTGDRIEAEATQLQAAADSLSTDSTKTAENTPTATTPDPEINSSTVATETAMDRNDNDPIRRREQAFQLMPAIQRLADATHSLVEVVRQFDELADGASVLAQNTSIQSVAAGATGDRWDAVAWEVERLADYSHDASDEIGNAVKSVDQELALITDLTQALANDLAQAQPLSQSPRTGEFDASSPGPVREVTTRNMSMAADHLAALVADIRADLANYRLSTTEQIKS